MIEQYLTPDYIVLAAGVVFTIGYAIINQVVLRIMILAGTLLYIWYYFTVGDDPLWAAIYTSVAMGLANISGMLGLYLRNSRLCIPRKHRDIYDRRFSNVPPGDFRNLMRHAHREVLAEPLTITTEGGTVSRLYFVVSGEISITKRGERFTMPSGLFVGEIAYLTGHRSSATTWLSQGAEVLVWDFENLRRIGRRKPRFKLALEAMISLDLAVKVAFAVAPHQPGFSPDEVAERLDQGASASSGLSPVSSSSIR